MNGPSLVCAGCNQPTTIFKPVCDTCLAYSGCVDMAGKTPEPLCKHDWVGDDNCAYCRVEELEAAIQSVIDDELDRVSPGVKNELTEALGSASQREVGK